MNDISQPQRVDASVPAVYFFYLSIYHLLFPYLGTAQRLSPAPPSDLNADPNENEENDTPKQEDVSTCHHVVVPSFFHYHLFTVITCSLLFINQ